MNPQARLISIPEFAALVGISPDSVRRMISRGQVRCVRVLRRVLVPKSEVDRICAPQGEGAARPTTGQPPKEKSVRERPS
jgi:excisionase family DNA binding protein